MRQSKLMSLVEAVTNVIIGLLVAVATQIVVFPVLGLHASLGQNLKLALVFTGVSIARSYALRRRFEAIGVGPLSDPVAAFSLASPSSPPLGRLLPKARRRGRSRPRSREPQARAV